MAEQWVVIDFETASTRSTPCQLGAVKYRHGNEVDQLETLIFEPPELFAEFNMALHGITPERVSNAPRWPEALEQLLAFAGNAPLIAHYAPFDIGVIRDASDQSEIEWPTLRYACTVTISRKIWPALHSYSLLLLCSALGISFNEWLAHDALADARLAGAVLRKALAESSAFGLDELLQSICVVFGRLAPNGWYGSHARNVSLGRAFSALEPNPDADPDSPLYEKHVAFTGELPGMVRRDAGALVHAVGGIPQNAVTRQTDFLVCGYQEVYKLAQGETKSAKLRYAEELRAAGQPIDILTEREFYRLLTEAEAIAQYNRTDAANPTLASGFVQ